MPEKDVGDAVLKRVAVVQARRDDRLVCEPDNNIDTSSQIGELVIIIESPGRSESVIDTFFDWRFHPGIKYHPVAYLGQWPSPQIFPHCVVTDF